MCSVRWTCLPFSFQARTVPAVRYSKRRFWGFRWWVRGAVRFPKSAGQAARDVRGGEGTVALYLNPLTAEDVFRVTATGELMPQKSTFFHPKIPTGLVFRLHGDAS